VTGDATGSDLEAAPTSDTPPFLRIVKGDPTPEELAALVTVLASLSTAPESPDRPAREWNSPRRLHRVVHPHLPGGWRASGLPR
jgi:hypothetical protein